MRLVQNWIVAIGHVVSDFWDDVGRASVGVGDGLDLRICFELSLWEGLEVSERENRHLDILTLSLHQIIRYRLLLLPGIIPILWLILGLFLLEQNFSDIDIFQIHRQMNTILHITNLRVEIWDILSEHLDQLVKFQLLLFGIILRKIVDNRAQRRQFFLDNKKDELTRLPVELLTPDLEQFLENRFLLVLFEILNVVLVLDDDLHDIFKILNFLTVDFPQLKLLCDVGLRIVDGDVIQNLLLGFHALWDDFIGLLQCHDFLTSLIDRLDVPILEI